MNWPVYIFLGTGLFSSFIIMIDSNLSHVCMTQGCEIIRKSHSPKLHRLMLFLFGFASFAVLMYMQLWFPENSLIGGLSFTATIYGTYFMGYMIWKYNTLCKFTTAMHVSMLFIFLIWFAETIGTY